MCTFNECDRSFYDKGNLKYHERTAHSLESKNFPFTCEHICCNIKFKTKREKLLHHDKFEPICKDEKDSLVQLIDKFQSGINSMIYNFDLDIKTVEKNEDYIKLQSEFEETKKLINTDFFRKLLGEKLNICKNIKKESTSNIKLE